MSLETEVADLKEKVEAMTDCASATKEAYAQISELKDKIVALENTIQTKDEELVASKAAYEDLVNTAEAAKKSKDEEMEKTKCELNTALETIAAYKNKEEEMAKKEKKMKRMASLLEKGLDQEVASSAVDQFDSLEDSAFDAMVNLISSAAKKADKSEETTETNDNPVEEKKKSKSSVPSEDVLDTAEPNQDIDLSAGSDVAEEGQTTRAALVDFVCARLGKKLNKGE